MRVFVAADLPLDVRDALAEQVAPVQRSWPLLGWVKPERWHLTLTFIGDIDPPALEPLLSRLERASARTQPFHLALGGPGRFGNRVLFVKVDGDVAALRRLAQRTTAASRRAGIAVPEERYRPHLTLARARQQADLRPVMAALPSTLDAPAWPVREIVLMQSMLGPDPRHEILASFPLVRRHLGSAP